MNKQKFLDAVDHADCELVEKGLKLGFSPDTLYRDQPILAVAVRRGHYGLAKLLLDNGADANAGDGLALWNGLAADTDGDLDLIRLLADRGADLELVWEGRDEGFRGSPLMGAIYLGRIHAARFLMERGARLDVRDPDGTSAFGLANQMGFLKLGATMLANGYVPAMDDQFEQAFLNEIQSAPELHDNIIETRYTGRILPRPPALVQHTSGLTRISSCFDGASLPGCSNPPIHLLGLDLPSIEGLPQSIRDLGTLHIIYTNCEDCDGPDYVDFDIGGDGVLSLYEGDTDWDYPDDWDDDEADGGPEMDASDADEEDADPDGDDPAGDEAPDCAPAAYSPSRQVSHVRLEAVAEGDSRDAAIEIGGEPSWVQTPDWASCARCGNAMFYIGHVWQYELPPGAEGADNHLYSFVCPACRMSQIVRQRG